jgi:cysteine protease ATG4
MNTFKHRALRYFFDPEPRNEDPSAKIWCLGQQYVDTPVSTSPAEQSNAREVSPQSDASAAWPTAFLDDFESRIWMTYRTDFPSIRRSQQLSPPRTISSSAAALEFAGKLFKGVQSEGFSSDVGWGCMIRSAQSLLANALLTLHLGRGKHLDRREVT